MKNELILKFNFEASHSLAGYEVPHPHLWKLEVVLSGKPVEGMIVDMVQLRSEFENAVFLLKNTFLNDNPHIGDEARKFPTCETLSAYFVGALGKILKEKFIPRNPSIRLESVMVAIFEADQQEFGAVRLILGA